MNITEQNLYEAFKQDLKDATAHNDNWNARTMVCSFFNLEVLKASYLQLEYILKLTDNTTEEGIIKKHKILEVRDYLDVELAKVIPSEVWELL